jgi:ABC-type multidrug transport system ATPase subunit
MIVLRNLRKTYGSQQAVRGISLEIPPGQLVGMLGPNGAGKSTTIKMLTGILAPSGGSAEIFGRDVATDPVGVKSIVGYVPESAPSSRRSPPGNTSRWSPRFTASPTPKPKKPYSNSPGSSNWTSRP